MSNTKRTKIRMRESVCLIHIVRLYWISAEFESDDFIRTLMMFD